jgi:hypothetical protein
MPRQRRALHWNLLGDQRGEIGDSWGELALQGGADPVMQHLRRGPGIIERPPRRDRGGQDGVWVVTGQLGGAQQPFQRPKRLIRAQALAVDRADRAVSGEPIQGGGRADTCASHRGGTSACP